MTKQTKTKITPRQLECLVNIYLKDQGWEGKRTQERFPWKKGDDEAHIPSWGRPDSYSWSSNKGGAVRRMRDAIGEAGFLPLREGKYSHWYSTDELTAKGLKVLREYYPDLPDLDAAILARESHERAEAEKAAQETQERQIERERAREAAKTARAEQMAAILRDYQISHSLTKDQLRALWLRVVDEEMKL